MLPSADCQVIRPDFRIQTAQAFNITQPCICLFEHASQRDNKLPTSQGVEDIEQQLPQGEVAGLSSCVAPSGLWKVFTKPAYRGTSQSVDATNGMKEVPLFEGLNDQVQSVPANKARRCNTAAGFVVISFVLEQVYRPIGLVCIECSASYMNCPS